MNTLVLLQGIPGAGKSTFIKENGLEPYTLSPDTLRLMFSSLEMGIDDMGISQAKNRKVFPLMMSILEERMKDGAFTVIDATHCSLDSVNAYKQLAKTYKYRTFVVRFDVTLDEAIERNKNRGYKSVPVEVLMRMDKALKTFEPKAWFKTITPDMWDVVTNQWNDNSTYERIVHIGDIHGCFDPLSKINFNAPKTLFIFMGDLFDRGIQNGEVAKLIVELVKRPNVLFLYGNHEHHVRDYVANGETPGEAFKETVKELKVAGVTKEELKNFVSHLLPVYSYTYGDKRIICSHAGISFEPEDLRLIDPRQFIKGIGGYDFDVDKVFKGKTEETYQIHGHRNSLNLPTHAGPKSFNLNTSVENGESLRTLVLSKDGFSQEDYTNSIFKEDPAAMNFTYRSLLKDKDITKKEFGDVVSMNFSREVFYGKKWTAKTILARGLFCNKNTTEVLARGYEKFFAMNENEATSTEVIKNLKYPLTAYRKENGYLGLLGINNGELMFCSKSSITSDFANWFEDIIRDTVSNLNELKTYLVENNSCMVFEVLDTKNDTHIIPGTERRCVLLDVINRDFKFQRLEYTDLQQVATQFGMDCKIKEAVFDNFEDFEKFAEEVVKYDYRLDGKPVEGFVVEDSSEKIFHFKLKTGYYTFWKILRNIIERGQTQDDDALIKNLTLYGMTAQITKGKEILAKYNSTDEKPTLFELEA